ncbi:MAG: TasA family protein [Sciscionella sp.]
MNKKFAIAVGAVAVIGAAMAVTAGTYSYFSAQQHTPASTRTAGTLTLDLGRTVSGDTIDLDTLKPGDSISETLTLQNTGNVTGELYAKINSAGSPALADVLQAEVDKAGTAQPVFKGTLLRMVQAASSTRDLGRMQPKDIQTYTITISWPTTNPDAVDNAVQGLSGTSNIDFTLRQVEAPSP